jgi:hypothetical protein
MAKFKKPILLQEEFAAGEVSSNPTTPAVKTTVDTVGTEQVAANKSGEQVRAEIVQDVDTILTNLEQLSKQITEETLSAIDASIESIFEAEYTEAINEDFMAELIKQAKSMKAYSVLKSSYPKLKKNLAKAKSNKVESESEFELNSDEKIGDLKDKIKAKYQKAIDKINDSDLPTPKKKAQRDAIYKSRDEALSPEKSQMIKDKIAAEKLKLQKRNDASVRDVNTAITELTGENKIEAELMAKRWSKEKIELDDEFDQKAIDAELELKLKYSKEDPEAQKKIQARFDKRGKEEDEEKARRAKEAEADLKAYQSKMAEEDADASDKEVKAREKVNAFIASSQALIGTLTGDDKDKIKEANKTYTEAKAAATDSVYKATQEGMSDEDAKQAKLQIEEAVDQAMEKYKTTLREITTDQETKKEEKYEMTDDDRLKVSDEENSIKDREGKLATEMEKPEEERNQEKIEGLKKGIAKSKQDIAAIKAGPKGESAEVKETEELEEGNEFGAARAEAIAKGEKTFKVGDEEYPVEDVSKDDKENAEEFVEEAKEELPKKIKLYEGMSVADKFKALM